MPRNHGLILSCFTSLTCGTTWHAAGLLGKLRSSAAETKLSSYSVELYSTLEEETGVGTGKIINSSGQGQFRWYSFCLNLCM